MAPRGPGLWDGPSLGQLISRAVDAYPDEVAFVEDATSARVTYAELGSRVGRLVGLFDDLGLKKGDVVAQLSSNRIEVFVTMAAAYVAGLVEVPLHPLASVDDQAYILSDCGAKALLFDPGGFDAVAGELTAAARLQHTLSYGTSGVGQDISADLHRPGGDLPAVRSEASDLARLGYTGGTTGRSKGTMLTHRALVEQVKLTRGEIEWPAQVRYLCCSPMSHASGYFIIPTLLLGGTYVIQQGFSAPAVLEAIERHQITATLLVPTMLYRLLDEPSDADTSSLQLVVYGAAPTSPARLEQGIERFGPVFQQAYGLTEAPVAITTLRRSEHVGDQLSSCGRPFSGVQVALLDDGSQPVPRGDVGELCVRGPLVMDGYWNLEEETRRTLRDGWLHTGDMAHEDGRGFLYLVDRKKDMIISGGFNVYPREVEDVLVTHPAVASAAVVGRPDDVWGEAVTAVVATRPGQEVDAEELKALVRERKGPVHTPKDVIFRDSMPLTSVGKVDKKLLREELSREAGSQPVP